MALVEGGPWHCNIHNDFETTDREEWNKHCVTTQGHYEEGTTVCVSCREEIRFEGLRFHPYLADGTKNIVVVCEDCGCNMCKTKKVSKIKEEHVQALLAEAKKEKEAKA